MLAPVCNDPFCQDFSTAVYDTFGYKGTLSSVQEGSGAGTRRAEIRYHGIQVTYIVSRMGPAEAYSLVSSAQQQQEKLQNKLYISDIFSSTLATVLQPVMDVSGGAFECSDQYNFNDKTNACCPSKLFLPRNNANVTKMIWTSSCSWVCLPPYVLWNMSCMTCSERNSLALDKTKPSFSLWDDTGASPNCTGWVCAPGYIPSADGVTCIQYVVALQLCAAYTSCAMCSLSKGCVWCNRASGCVPGQFQQPNGSTCAYNANGTLGCTCEAAGCQNECTEHGSCESCMGNRLCGWCEGTRSCLLDIKALPVSVSSLLNRGGTYVTCPDGWLVHSLFPSGTVICPAKTTNLLVVVISSCLSTIAVAILIFVILFRCGYFNRGLNTFRQEALPARLLSNIPTFKYSGQPRTWRLGCAAEINLGAEDARDIEEQEGCSICLAEFVEGDELRMLGCLHVFHRRCVDQWFAVARECPLCKRDVLAAAAADPTVLAGAAFAARQGRSYDPRVLQQGRMGCCRFICFRISRQLAAAANIGASSMVDANQSDRTETGDAQLLRPTLIIREETQQVELVLDGRSEVRGPFQVSGVDVHDIPSASSMFASSEFGGSGLMQQVVDWAPSINIRPSTFQSSLVEEGTEHSHHGLSVLDERGSELQIEDDNSILMGSLRENSTLQASPLIFQRSTQTCDESGSNTLGNRTILNDLEERQTASKQKTSPKQSAESSRPTALEIETSPAFGTAKG